MVNPRRGPQGWKTRPGLHALTCKCRLCVWCVDEAGDVEAHSSLEMRLSCGREIQQRASLYTKGYTRPYTRINNINNEIKPPQQTWNAKIAKLHLHTMQELPRRARLLGCKVPLCLPFPNTSQGDVVAACEHGQSDGCDEQGAVHSTGSEWST